MKLSKPTLEILDNFSSMNQSIKFSGNVLKTIVGDIAAKSVQAVAIAEIEETIKNEVAIYDLQSFLGLINLYRDSDFDIEFDKNFVVLKANRKSTKFKYCNPNIISDVPEIEIDDNDILVEFQLTSETLAEIIKVSKILSFKGFYFKTVNNKLEIHLYDVTSINNTPEHVISLDVETDKNFDIYFEFKSLYVLNGTYNVKLTEDLVYFKSIDCELEYYIVTSNEPE